LSRKKRILWCGEFTELSTGYSVYGKNLLQRLSKNPNIEIAEFASYVHITDPRLQSVPWKIYCNLPESNDKKGQKVYALKPSNQFGEWRLEEVLLDYKPDIVLSMRDNWMDAHIAETPLKKYFSWIWNAPCDSIPQMDEWIDMMINDCDMVFSYTDWAQEQLKREGGGLINLKGIAPPCADHDIFKPIPQKKDLRKFYNLDPDLLIVGTVMRNQKRKLFPDLFEAFRLYLDKCKENNNETLYNKSFLLCHTSYPDIGWDIPKLVREFDISNKILFTYFCRNDKCNHISISYFSGARTVCQKCGTDSCGLPHVQTQIPPQVLAQIYNCMDLYVQYSMCEGQGMPQIESACCGVPVMGTNYSAMESVIPKLKGTLIDVQKMFRESETGAYRAYPDNQDFANKLYKFFQLPESIRKKKGFDAHQGALKHFNWDEVSKKWEKLIDESPYASWDAPINLHQPPSQIPNIPDNEKFVTWCIENILGRPDKTSGYFAVKQTRNLNYGQEQIGFGGLYLSDQSLIGTKQEWKNFDRNILVQNLLKIVENRNYWESRRTEQMEQEKPPFIQAANVKR